MMGSWVTRTSAEIVGIIRRRIILHRPCQKSYPSFQIGRYLFCHIRVLTHYSSTLHWTIASISRGKHMRAQLLLLFTATTFFYIIDRTLKTSFSLNPLKTILFVRVKVVLFQ